MTIGEMLGKLEDYYGTVDCDAIRRALVEYLRDEIDPSSLELLGSYVTRTHPRSFGPPDVAALEKARRYAFEKDGRQLGRTLRGSSWSSAEGVVDTRTDAEREEAARLLGTIFARLGEKRVGA